MQTATAMTPDYDLTSRLKWLRVLNTPQQPVQPAPFRAWDIVLWGILSAVTVLVLMVW